MTRVVCIGECMVEFSRRGEFWAQGFAGDTLNVAWALRALLPEGWAVDYLTRLGDDGFSEAMLAFFAEAGLGTGLIARDKGGRPGLYTIATDAQGERRFDYWRSAAPARRLADDPDALRAALAGAALVYFSGITLAILPEAGRRALLEALSASGARIAFDPNFRPALWEDADTARRWSETAAAAADIALPTHDDEAAAFGDPDAAASLARYAALASESVVKDGPNPTRWALGGESGAVEIPRMVAPRDTTGAGDGFNGVYLARRLLGDDPTQAIRAAQAASAAIILRPGALVAPETLREAAGRSGG